MHIEFANFHLERLYGEADYRGKNYHPEIIKKYKKVVLFIHYATDIRDIYAHSGLCCEKLGGTDKYSIRLNKQWRLIFILQNIGTTQVVMIEKISKHYE